MRDNSRLLCLIILSTLVVSFFMNDDASIGASIVAIPAIGYLQYILHGRDWLAERRNKSDGR